MSVYSKVSSVVKTGLSDAAYGGYTAKVVAGAGVGGAVGAVGDSNNRGAGFLGGALAGAGLGAGARLAQGRFFPTGMRSRLRQTAGPANFPMNMRGNVSSGAASTVAAMNVSRRTTASNMVSKMQSRPRFTPTKMTPAQNLARSYGPGFKRRG